MTLRQTMLRTTAIIALPFAANTAFAQSSAATPSPATADANAGDGDIIVTATRQETLLQNTPVAITALSAASLEQRGVRSLVDIGNYVPNLTVGGRAGQGTNSGSVAMRGIGSDAPDSAPSVGIYIDDVYYPTVDGNLLGLFDVSRVEVLRGPQGTLFGRNTIAGAIQYVSVKPKTGNFSGFGFASAGNLSSYELSGAVNVPLGETLAIRISGQAKQQGGYVYDRLNNVDRGQNYSEQGRAQLRWQPNDRLTVDLKAETVKMRSNGRPVTPSGFNPANASVYFLATGVIPLLPPFLTENRPFSPDYITPKGKYGAAGFNQPDYFRLGYDAANAVIAYDVSDAVTLKSISAYSFTKTRTVNDYDSTPLSIFAVDRGPIRTRLFTQEFQLTGQSFGDALNWTTGVYYYNGREAGQGSASTIGLAALPFGPATRIKTESYAVYGQATLKLTDQISATGGLRYSREDINAVYTNGAFPQGKRRFTDTSPYAGLNWQVNDDTLLYAKASKGFRAGGVHLDPAFTGGSLFFGPERAWTYEAGARLQFFDRRLRFNPTIFQTDWDNIQFVYISLPAGAPVVATRNAGDARMKGIELETQFSVTRALQLTGSFSYLDAHYRRLAPPVLGTIPVMLTLKDPLARAPKYKYALGARYTLETDDGGQLIFSSDYAWTDRQRSSVDGDQAIVMPSFGLLSARVEFTPAGKNFTFALYGTNLTDKYHLIDGLNFQSNTGVLIKTPGRPREYGASVRVSF